MDTIIKPILISAIHNKNMTLNRKDVLHLSEWIIMKAIVAENDRDNIQVTPIQDIKLFYEIRKIPEYFRIYICKHNSPYESFYHRHSLKLGLSKKGPLTNLDGTTNNTQTISLIIGPLFIFVIACREENYKIWQHFKLNRLKCIFPMKKNSFNLSSLKSIDEKRLKDTIHSLNVLSSITNYIEESEIN